VLVVGAVLHAVKSGDGGWLDVIRFLVGAVGGCLIGIALRRLADIARRLAPIGGVCVAIVVIAAGGFRASASIWLSGAFAGMLVTVGLLYPLPQFRSERG
jgi:hypothetical protein